jgi:transposase
MALNDRTGRAKHVFQVHGLDEEGPTVLRKRLRRAQISDFFGSLARRVVGLEATQGSHYWARVIGSYGHEVRLIAPRFVGRRTHPAAY